MSGQEDTPRDPLLAAEHALSLLDGDERQAAERRMYDDPAFRAEVEAWQEELSSLAGEFAEVPPRPALKRRVMGRLFGAERSRRVWPWQAFGLASFAAAIALAALVFAPQLTPPGPAGDTLSVAQVVSEDGSLAVLAAYDPEAGGLRYALVRGAAPTGRVLELWGIQGDAAPVSLGVIDAAGRTPLPEGLAVEGLVLAVSDEPPGGSPTGAPTGSVLAVGQITGL